MLAAQHGEIFGVRVPFAHNNLPPNWESGLSTPPDRSAAVVEASNAAAHSALFAALYDELRRVAQRELRRGGGLTLSATTLLHETYFKIQQRPDVAFPDEARFVAYAARAMRTLVIDYARNRQAQKRGGAFEITSLPTELPEQAVEADELEKMGTAIDTLAQLDAALAELVDLKFFCGYSLIEIAAMRGVSERTAQRDWDKARVLLKRVLEGRGFLPGE
jgi:RNA polymerase sigma factor (TIGR02999 family)